MCFIRNSPTMRPIKPKSSSHHLKQLTAMHNSNCGYTEATMTLLDEEVISRRVTNAKRSFQWGLLVSCSSNLILLLALLYLVKSPLQSPTVSNIYCTVCNFDSQVTYLKITQHLRIARSSMRPIHFSLSLGKCLLNIRVGQTMIKMLCGRNYTRVSINTFYL